MSASTYKSRSPAVAATTTGRRNGRAHQPKDDVCARCGFLPKDDKDKLLATSRKMQNTRCSHTLCAPCMHTSLEKGVCAVLKCGKACLRTDVKEFSKPKLASKAPGSKGDPTTTPSPTLQSAKVVMSNTVTAADLAALPKIRKRSADSELRPVCSCKKTKWLKQVEDNNRKRAASEDSGSDRDAKRRKIWDIRRDSGNDFAKPFQVDHWCEIIEAQLPPREFGQSMSKGELRTVDGATKSSSSSSSSSSSVGSTSPTDTPSPPLKASQVSVDDDDIEEGEIEEDGTDRVARSRTPDYELSHPAERFAKWATQHESALLPVKCMQLHELLTYILSEYKTTPARRVDFFLPVTNLKPLQYNVLPVVRVCDIKPGFAELKFHDTIVKKGVERKQFNFIGDVEREGALNHKSELDRIRYTRAHHRHIFSDDPDFWKLVTDPLLQHLWHRGLVKQVLVTPPTAKDANSSLMSRTIIKYAVEGDDSVPKMMLERKSIEAYKRELRSKGLVLIKNVQPMDKGDF